MRKLKIDSFKWDCPGVPTSLDATLHRDFKFARYFFVVKFVKLKGVLLCIAKMLTNSRISPGFLMIFAR